MDKSNDFLQSYKTPIIIKSVSDELDNHGQLISPVNNDKTNGSRADVYPSSTTLIQESQQALLLVVENESKQQNHTRILTFGNQVADSPSTKRPIKRKLCDALGSGGCSTSFLGRDESYPDSLNALFKPLFCELCNAHLNSSKTASTHYMSKTHDRNIKTWLTRNYTNKGLEAPTVKRFYGGDTGCVGPNAYHCECCDLNLTSRLHAEQHYSGRKHKLVLSNISKPSGTGYYNADGKWVRTGTKAVNDGRFGIGEQFKSKISDCCDGNELGLKTQPETKTQVTTQNVTVSESLTCKLCKINVTSPLQMSLHLAGNKHRKKVKATGEQFAASAAIKENDTVLSSLNEAVPAINDISMYRTPSGSYYCKTCNLSIVHQSALVQHLVGKKHIKKSILDNTIVTN